MNPEEMKQFIIQWLPVIMQQDSRLAYHTLTEVDGVFTDTIKKCPRCQAEWILSGCPPVDKST
jgi:hypothetical protein